MAAIPARMTVIGIKAPGAPEMLVPEERAVAAPGEGEILVKVAAAGVNRPDVMQRQGNYPPPPGAPDIPGLEIAGEIVALGPNVKRWKIGDRVMALVIGGGYAEYCLAHGSHALPVSGLTMVEAAAIPETFFTVWHNAFERGGLKAGETLLVHGGSSGIGTTAIQLAKAFGARVIVTAGSEENARPAASSAPTSQLTIRPRTSSPPPRRPPATRAPILSSTWWAAITSRAITRRHALRGASCRSHSRAATRRRSTSAA